MKATALLIRLKNLPIILLGLVLLFNVQAISAQLKGKGGNGPAKSGRTPTKNGAGPARGNEPKKTTPKSLGDRKPESNNAVNRLGNNNDKKNNINNSGNKTNNINSGNRNINIDNSKNVNVNVNKNVRVNNNVRHNNYRPYTRPPYAYGGRRYYCHYSYAYHPYRPFYWGPAYHPWGFFIAALATTAIIISIENQKYHYDQGVYYVASNGGYTVVQAPVGATITTLPPSSQTVIVNETTNNYYYGGTYYEKSDKGYTVVPPTAGAIVENLPEGAKEETIGDQKYMKLGDVYYQPIQKDGKNMYEVVQIEEDEKK